MEPSRGRAGGRDMANVTTLFCYIIRELMETLMNVMASFLTLEWRLHEGAEWSLIEQERHSIAPTVLQLE